MLYEFIQNNPHGWCEEKLGLHREHLDIPHNITH
jgi:hypothetical protein